jgi:small subunit ribosomal protein S9
MAAKKKPDDAEPEQPSSAEQDASADQASEQAAASAGPDAAAQPDAPAAETQEPEPEAPQARAAAESDTPAAEVSTQDEAPAAAEAPAVESAEAPPAAQPSEPADAGEEGGAAAVEQAGEGAEESAPAPRVKPAVPGAHLEVDIVPEGVDPLGREEEYSDPYAIAEEDLEPVVAEQAEDQEDEALAQPIASAAIDLAAGARYRATGKRKTAIARVTLRPGSGTYVINGRTLEEHFPRVTLQRNIRQPLETVGYQERMDVVARLHGGGISAQAGALRHGVSRALLEADPNLRGELKRRGFLTRDSRAKERKKAGLKKARKRPQFSKR